MCLCMSTAEREMGLCCGQGKTPNSPGTWKPRFLNSSSNNDPQGFGLSGRNAFWLLSFSGRVKHVPHRGPRRTSTEFFQTSPYQSYFQASSSSNQKLNLPKFRPHLNTSLSYWNFLRGLSTSNVLKLSPLFICTSCTTTWCNWVMCRKTVKGVSSVRHLLTHITSQPVFDCM